MMLRSPGFTGAVAVTLALGIGANTAIFSIVDTLILKAPPGVARPQGLVWISTIRHGRLQPSSYPDYLDFRGMTDIFSGALAVQRAAVHVSRGGEPERVQAQIVSENALDVIEAAPALGRGFLAGDRDEARPVAVLGDRYWRRVFEADPRAVGSTLIVNGRAYTVIGVAPARLTGLTPDPEEIADLFLPLTGYFEHSGRRAQLTNRDSSWLWIQARLRPGVSVAQASAAAATVARRAARLRARDRQDLSATATPLMGWVPPGQLHQVLPFALFGLIATALVLLIACANVANLLLARAAGHRCEIGIRLALGASRPRLVRQLLTESVLLALLGSAAGLLLSLWSIDFLLARFGAPAALAPTLDGRVGGYAVALAIATGIVFGLAPAWKASRRELVPSLKDEGPREGRHSGAGLQGGLVIAQISISLVLLAAAGLFLRSLQKAAAVDIGLDRASASRVLAASFDLETQGYTPEKCQEFFRALLARVQTDPGVLSAALAETLPLSGRAIGDAIAPEGALIDSSETGIVFINAASPGYFETLGPSLLAGRDFAARDREGAPLVAIVNETLARGFWSGQDPIGKRLQAGEPPSLFEVVGMAKNGKYIGMTEAPRSFVYFPILQRGSRFGETILLARFSGGLPSIQTLKADVRAIDPGLPLFRARSLEQALQE